MLRQPRLPVEIIRAAVLFGMALLFAAPVGAQSNQVVLVEEHWELRLGQPAAPTAFPSIPIGDSAT